MPTELASGDSPTFIPVECLPNVENLITEDDTPADGILSEKQMRLLTESLISSWSGPGEGRPFVTMANVGVFYSDKKPAVVPDVLLSIDVELPENVLPKSARSYFIWSYDKPPDVVVEVVSNREGGEDTTKLGLYARIGVRYYAIFDRERHLSDDLLRVFRLEGMKFQQMREPIWFPEVELGMRLWTGTHEKLESTWLRWGDPSGKLVPTGYERAEAASARAERLAEKLRQLGIEPNGQ